VGLSGLLNRSAVLAIAGRDLRVVLRSRAVLLPSVLVPVVLLLVPPLVLLTAVDAPSVLSDELQLLLARLPPDIPSLPEDPHCCTHRRPTANCSSASCSRPG
jgi:hypothetical protein